MINTHENEEPLIPDRISCLQIQGPYALHVHTHLKSNKQLRVAVGFIDADNQVFDLNLMFGEKTPLHRAGSYGDGIQFMMSHFNLLSYGHNP